MNLDQVLAHVRDAAPDDLEVQRLVEAMAVGNLSARGALAWRVCVKLSVVLPDQVRWEVACWGGREDLSQCHEIRLDAGR